MMTVAQLLEPLAQQRQLRFPVATRHNLQQQATGGN